MASSTVAMAYGTIFSFFHSHPIQLPPILFSFSKSRLTQLLRKSGLVMSQKHDTLLNWDNLKHMQAQNDWKLHLLVALQTHSVSNIFLVPSAMVPFLKTHRQRIPIPWQTLRGKLILLKYSIFYLGQQWIT